MLIREAFPSIAPGLIFVLVTGVGWETGVLSLPRNESSHCFLLPHFSYVLGRVAPKV